MGEDSIQVAVRFPADVIARFDRLAADMTTETRVKVTRSDVIRLAAADGLDALERARAAQKGGKPTQKPKK